MTGPSWFELEERIEASPAEVFPYLADPERYVRWMGVEAAFDARPGAPYRVKMPRGDWAVGEFVELEPDRRVVFTWGWEGDEVVPPGSTTVEITLEAKDGGTIVRLRHSGLPDEGTARDHTEGWTKYLGRLASLTAGVDPGPDTYSP